MDEMWGDNKAKNEEMSLNKEWFRNAKYAMFVHWGLFSEVAGQWKGVTYYGISEWQQSHKALELIFMQCICRR